MGISDQTTYGGRPKMPLEDRAKIFSPFDPLQGFREALRQKEREVEAANQEPWEQKATGQAEELLFTGRPAGRLGSCAGRAPRRSGTAGR